MTGVDLSIFTPIEVALAAGLVNQTHLHTFLLKRN